MSDFENDNDSILSDDNNINLIEEIENSYKIYINQLTEIISDVLDKLIRKNSLEENNSNKDENGEIVLLNTMITLMDILLTLQIKLEN